MKIRRMKPYVCVDCDYWEHYRFQDSKDLDAAAGTWLRCLAYSRAQEQDGLVKASWLQRTFATTFERVEDLLRVGLLRRRDDGDYELHAYAPRNQTRAMLEAERVNARERMASARNSKASSMRGRSGEQAPNTRRTITERTANNHRTNGEHTANSHRTTDDVRDKDRPEEPSGGISEHARGARKVRLNVRVAAHEGALSSPFGASSEPLSDNESESDSEALASVPMGSPEQEANERRTNAFVPTSTSTSIKCTSTSSSPSLGVGGDHGSELHDASVHRGGPGGAARALPASERGVSGALWLQAFTDGVTDHTKRPCTAGRMYLGTLERLVTHHAPKRDAASGCAWLREQARAFAAQWDGKHPAKGLTPDGLERWLNDGRQGPPEFGRPRIVQPAAEDWHEDDWSDLGAEVVT